MRRILSLVSIVTITLACGPVFGGSPFPSNHSHPVSVEMEPLTLSMGVGISGQLMGEEMAGSGAGSAYRTYSAFREGAYSLLLPGLGQYRMGREVRAKIYFGLEGIAWIAMGGFLWHGMVKESTYKDYAVIYADVSGTEHPDNYWEDVGQFLSSEGTGGYNEYVRREARDMYPDDREAMESYYDAHKYTGELAWDWRSEDEYYRYRALRNDTRAAYRRSLYSLFFAFALRVVSAVDAVRIARSENSYYQGDPTSVYLKLDSFHDGFSLAIQKRF